MFFDASKENIVTMLLIAAIMGVGVVAALTADKRFSVLEHADIRVNQMRYGMLYQAREILNSADPRKTNLASAANSLMSLGSSPIVYKGDERAASIPVLVYHGIDDREGNVSGEAFEEQMRTLHEEGWQTVALPEFKKFMDGDIYLPDKSFLLTFDDGAKTSYYAVDPVLRDLGYNAVMFIITRQTLLWDNDLPSQYYLSPKETEYMIHSGRWEIESHGRDDHGYIVIDRYGSKGAYLSNREWKEAEERLETPEEFEERIQTDLINARTDIENFNGGKPVSTFAFPFGDFGQLSLNFPEAERIVKEATARTYEFAFHQASAADGDEFNYPREDAFMIKRIEPLPETSGGELVEWLSGGRAKMLPWSTADFGRDWIPTWGMVEGGDVLSLSSKSEESGAAVSLNGTYIWEDYTFTAASQVENDASISLIARYQNTENYLSCAFADNRVYIKEEQDGSSVTHSSREYAKEVQIPNGVETSLSITVEGQMVSCAIEGEEVLSVDVGDRLRRGGIGVSIWHAEQGAARASVHQVTVTP